MKLQYLTIFAIAFAVSGTLIAVDPVGKLAAYTYANGVNE